MCRSAARARERRDVRRVWDAARLSPRPESLNTRALYLLCITWTSSPHSHIYYIHEQVRLKVLHIHYYCKNVYVFINIIVLNLNSCFNHVKTQLTSFTVFHTWDQTYRWENRRLKRRTDTGCSLSTGQSHSSFPSFFFPSQIKAALWLADELSRVMECAQRLSSWPSVYNSTHTLIMTTIADN